MWNENTDTNAIMDGCCSKWDGVARGPGGDIFFTDQFLFLQSKVTTPCSSGVHWIPGMQRAEAKDVILAEHMDTWTVGDSLEER